jgi:hypothetical protein
MYDLLVLSFQAKHHASYHVHGRAGDQQSHISAGWRARWTPRDFASPDKNVKIQTYHIGLFSQFLEKMARRATAMVPCWIIRFFCTAAI